MQAHSGQASVAAGSGSRKRPRGLGGYQDALVDHTPELHSELKVSLSLSLSLPLSLSLSLSPSVSRSFSCALCMYLRVY